MKYFIAIILSLILHLSLYYIFSNEKISTQSVIENNTKQKNSTLRYVSLKKEKKVVPKKVIEKVPKKPKKIIKKVVKKPIKKPLVKKESPKKKIVKKKVISKKVIPKKKIVKKDIVKPIVQTQAQKEIQEVKQLEKQIDKRTQSYIDLYGEEFASLHPRTQIFLLKNLSSIAAVTQRYLEYPIMSAQAGQDGINVVEFILFPKGHISNLKIIRSSSYFMLDDNTLETIEESFREYPRPAQPTVIKIYVKYQLIRN